MARLEGLALLDQSAQGQVLAGRLQVWIAIATGDTAKWAQAAESFEKARDQIAELRERTIDPSTQPMVRDLARLLTTYQERAAALRSYRDGGGSMSEPEARALAAAAIQAGTAIATVSATLLASCASAAAEATEVARQATATARFIAITLGAGCVLAGVAIA